MAVVASPRALSVPAIPDFGYVLRPATLEQRLRVMRQKRAVSSATNLVAWILGLGALLTVVAGGLLGFR